MAPQSIISVILPVYNVEPYLSQCLESVYAQEVEGMEVICVNDGSTDGSRAIIQEFKNRYPKMVIFDRINGGLSAARNSGFKVATGKYIYYLDSDDYLLPGVLKQMVDFIEQNHLDVANFNVETSLGKKYFTIKNPPDRVLSGTEFFNQMSKLQFSLPVVPVWMYIYRKSFLHENKITFKEGIVLEDNHYTLRVLYLATRVHLLNIPIQYHRIQRIGAETHTVTNTQINSLLFTCRDLFDFYNKKHCEELYFYKRIFLIYLNIAARIIILKNYKEKNYTTQDYKIMKQCMISNYYILHYLLLRFKLFRFYDWYIEDTNYQFLKKNLRRLSRVYWKIFA